MNRGWRHWLTLPLWHPAGGACFLCRLPTLPLVCFSAPIPPTPFPAGRGRFLVDFAGGFAPGTPAAEPIGLRKTDKKRSLRVIPPPAEVPVRQEQPVPRPVQPWGCKGRSPLHEITLNLPLPRRGRALCERGLGDRGQQSKLKAESAGVPRRFSFCTAKKSLQFPEECAIINTLQAQPAQEAPQAGKQKERRNPHETVCCSQGRAD